MMATLGCMREYLTRMVFVGMLGMALEGAALMVSPAAWANEIKTDAASTESPVPNTTYDESQPGADDLRVKEGFAAYQAGDFKKAYDIWLPLAEAGNAEAQFRVGVLYDFGRGVLHDILKTIEWYELATKKGHASAAFNLALTYDLDKRVNPDSHKALDAFKIAAANGSVEAQHSLGIEYAIGNKAPRDFIEAYKWLFIAIHNGREEAMDSITKLNRFAASEDRNIGLKKMREWFENHPRK